MKENRVVIDLWLSRRLQRFTTYERLFFLFFSFWLTDDAVHLLFLLCSSLPYLDFNIYLLYTTPINKLKGFVLKFTAS